MTQSECEAREHPHNQRCRYTTGFLCEDCRTFFAKDSPTYIRYELPGDLWMVVHNIGVEYARSNMERPPEVQLLCHKLNDLSKVEDASKREHVLNTALRFISCHKKTQDSATMRLKVE